MDADISLEDGEIVDDCESIEVCEDNYTPLERPSNYSSTLMRPRFPAAQELESDEEEEVESSSGSDSDSDTKVKRPKLKIKPRAVRLKAASRRKYDIWSTHVQEDVLLENLVNCDVSQVDRSRNVETYPLPPIPPIVISKNNKRTRHDRNKSNLRPCQAPDLNNEANGVTGVPRVILDVHVTVENTEDEVAKDIANKLYEDKEDLIRNIVATAGKEKAIELFRQTKSIEEGGGMLIMNQTRRRTPGGVFLFLVKHDASLTREQHTEIFDEERVNYKKEVRAKRKMKLQQIKKKIAASKTNSPQNIPKLLTRANLCVQLAEDKDKGRRKSEDVDVINPPPSPVTDGHDNSTDGMETINRESDTVDDNHVSSLSRRSIINYDDDCLDVGTDMDMF